MCESKVVVEETTVDKDHVGQDVMPVSELKLFRMRKVWSASEDLENRMSMASHR